MEQAQAGYWYERAKAFMQKAAMNSHLPSETKLKLTEQYNVCTPENAEKIYQELIRIERDYYQARNYEMNLGDLKMAAVMLLIGGTIGFGGYLLKRVTVPSSRIHKYAGHGEMIGVCVAGLGVCLSSAIGH